MKSLFLDKLRAKILFKQAFPEVDPSEVSIEIHQWADGDHIVEVYHTLYNKWYTRIGIQLFNTQSRKYVDVFRGTRVIQRLK
jgi:hypothetical protein